MAEPPAGRIWFFAGIDPGKLGGVAVIDQDGQYHFGFHCPDGPGPMAKAFLDIKEKYPILLTGIEAVHAFPKQGVTSSFNFGAASGYWQGILSALNIPYILVTPIRWQRQVLDSSGKDHLTFARRRWPNAPLDRKKDEAIGAALCLAEYARLTHHAERFATK